MLCLMCFLQYHVDDFSTFTFRIPAHSYVSTGCSIDYLFKFLGGAIYFVLQWSETPVILYFYKVPDYYTNMFKLLLKHQFASCTH